MPFQGKFYMVPELQEILAPKDKERITRQAVHWLANYHDWLSLYPGTYCAEPVEEYLMGRGIDPALLPVRSFRSEQLKKMEKEDN